MRVAVHQPDLLPWSGFWFKMINCDRFVVAVHDQLRRPYPVSTGRPLAPLL